RSHATLPPGHYLYIQVIGRSQSSVVGGASLRERSRRRGAGRSRIVRRPGAERRDIDDFATLPGTASRRQESERLGLSEAVEVVLAAVVDWARAKPRFAVDLQRHGDGPEPVVGRTMGCGPDCAEGRGGTGRTALQARDQGTDEQTRHGERRNR